MRQWIHPKILNCKSAKDTSAQTFPELQQEEPDRSLPVEQLFT